MTASAVSRRSEPAPGALPWFAVRVRANFEKTVALALRGKGYEEFLPLYQMRRRWSDRYRTLELPLFPGYLFCRIDMGHRLPLLVTPGLLGIVSFGGIPLPVDDAELAAVQSIVRSSLPAEPWTALSVGTRVRIQAGPLSGVEGVLQQFDGSCRILVSVTLLQRSVSVKVDRSWVYPHAWEEHPIARFRTASCGPASPQRS